MPSFRKKVVGFIRQLSNPGITAAESEPLEGKSTNGSFIKRYLCGEPLRCQPEVLCGRSFQDLPVQRIAALSPVVRAAYTGPAGGLTRIQRHVRHVDVRNPNLAFIDEEPSSWRTPKLAQQEDLDEFLDDANRNTQVTEHQSQRSSKERKKLNNAKKWKTSERQIRKPSPSVTTGDVGCSCEDKSDGENDIHLQKLNNAVSLQESDKGCCKEGFIHDCADDFKDSDRMKIAGVNNWNMPHNWAFGTATSLYERHPLTQTNTGDPIADAFAVCVRDNSALLVLADGVNWGEKSCLAARCAVHGCVDYINNAVFDTHSPVETTKDIFLVLLRSLFAAHNLILEEDGMLTTLCVAFVCPLEESDKFVVCTCNVGDSFAYVYSSTNGVREITQGSHDINSMRDMRDALGALGPVDGLNPELNNLTCSMTVVEVGDIVFLTSDGISDNFDPVVGKFAVPKESERNNNHNSNNASGPSSQNGQCQPQGDSDKGGQQSHNNLKSNRPTQVVGPTAQNVSSVDTVGLPVVEAHQRHALTLLRMEDLLVNGVTEGDRQCESAKEVCEALIDFATKLTVAKRRILEDPDLYRDGDQNLTFSEQKERRKKLGDKLAMIPGKLDHASVVAYRVGVWPDVVQSVEEDVKQKRNLGELADIQESSITEEPVMSDEQCSTVADISPVELEDEGQTDQNFLVRNKENMNPNLNVKGPSSLEIVRREKRSNLPIEMGIIESVV